MALGREPALSEGVSDQTVLASTEVFIWLIRTQKSSSRHTLALSVPLWVLGGSLIVRALTGLEGV